MAAPFVLCEGEGHAVLGYYTLSAISVDIGDWPENVANKLPRYPVVPATLMGRLAIHQQLQGQGAGEYLLMNALYRSLQVSRQVAAVAVIVDAKDEEAVASYRHYEFMPFRDRPDRLYLPMGIIEKLFAWRGGGPARHPSCRRASVTPDPVPFLSGAAAAARP